MPSRVKNGAEISKRYISDLKLVPHPEVGLYALTYVDPVNLESPFAENDSKRAVCSVIYYLLAPKSLDVRGLLGANTTRKIPEMPDKYRSHAGYFHTNASTTSHTWHSGKAVYTLIKQCSKDDKSVPEVKRITLGPDLSKGEQMQLIVPRGWWKRSELVDSENGHCLITETLCPAWDAADHEFMHEGHLKELFKSNQDLIEEFRENVLPKGHPLQFWIQVGDIYGEILI